MRVFDTNQTSGIWPRDDAAASLPISSPMVTFVQQMSRTKPETMNTLVDCESEDNRGKNSWGGFPCTTEKGVY
jgi:hypothetical protein